MTSYHVTSQHIASLLRKHKQPPPKRRHQTERLKAGEHKKIGLGSAPVVRPARVVWANSFFGLYGSSLWNFRARLARELLISRVYIIKLIKANLVTAVFNVLLYGLFFGKNRLICMSLHVLDFGEGWNWNCPNLEPHFNVESSDAILAILAIHTTFISSCGLLSLFLGPCDQVSASVCHGVTTGNVLTSWKFEFSGRCASDLENSPVNCAKVVPKKCQKIHKVIRNNPSISQMDTMYSTSK